MQLSYKCHSSVCLSRYLETFFDIFFAKNVTSKIASTDDKMEKKTSAKATVREGNLDTRGIWTLVVFKASYSCSMSYTQFMKTVADSYDIYVSFSQYP